MTTVNRTVLIGFAAGKNITTYFSDTQPNENVFIGYQAGYFTTNSTDNIFVGSEAGRLVV
ncbi:MAG: hypothetical protein AAF806_28020 [Bacteroidota bacterium]